MRQTLDRSGAIEAKTVAPRAQGGWRVGMKTFGTKHFISVVAKDVSASGLLVKVEDPKINAPFQTDVHVFFWFRLEQRITWRNKAMNYIYYCTFIIVNLLL